VIAARILLVEHHVARVPLFPAEEGPSNHLYSMSMLNMPLARSLVVRLSALVEGGIKTFRPLPERILAR
jgi:hypothetical protein